MTKTKLTENELIELTKLIRKTKENNSLDEEATRKLVVEICHLLQIDFCTENELHITCVYS